MDSTFFDNKSSLVKDDLVKVVQSGDRVSVAASVFSMYAYQELKEQLENLDEFRFVYTSQTFTKSRAPKEKREFYIPRLNREQGLYGTEFEIKLRNELTQKAVAAECANWIKRKAAFKSYEGDESVNNMLCVTKPQDNVAYTPFDEFSTKALGTDNASKHQGLTLRADSSQSKALLEQFDEAWNSDELQDVTEAVVDSITAMYQENAPELIYYMALYRIFNEFLEDITDDNLAKEGTGFYNSLIWNKLYDFQQDAVKSIVHKLQTYGGCILADSVGLGKTFTALAVIKYYELLNRNVLVLCPKKLKDNWQTYRSNYTNNSIAGDKLRYDILFHTDLSREKGQTEMGLNIAQVNWGNYDLVVIDESHNFRNGGDSASDDKMNRYQILMERVIKQGVETKVLMLSATPVNNRFRDLRNQLNLAYWNNPEEWTRKLSLSNDIETVFRNAQTVYTRWSNLPADQRTTDQLTKMLDLDFFQVLDQVTVARSRKHIQRYYDMEALGPFPHRNAPISKRPKLSTLKNAINYGEIYEVLEALKLAVYIPSCYLQPSRVAKYQEGHKKGITLAGRERGLHRLMSTNLLKRLESSVHSFRLTLSRVHEAMQAALKTIEDYKISGADSSVSDGPRVGSYDFDPDDESSFEVGGASKILLSDMDWVSWERDIRKDLDTMDILISMVQDIDPQHDAKLIELCEQVRDKMQNPINEGNRKVLVFTAFSDTAEYLYEHLSEYSRKNLGAQTALVTGDGCKCTLKAVGNDIQDVLTCFSPVSKERHLIAPSREGQDIDIVIATDCISEGQNLQDCDYMINFDIHWNPVRIVQRFGRVDRIGSKNSCIQLVNYWPDVELDEYIGLKDRVEQRTRILVMSATGDDDYVNPNENGDLEYRRRQLEHMQNENIDLEDVDGGVSITDLGLNEFRMDLVDYYRANPDIDHLPSGINAVVRGDDPGVIFVLRNVNNDVNIEGRNRLHPFYVVRMGVDGTVIHGHLQPKEVLDDMRLLCRDKSAPDMDLCRAYNRETKNGRDMRREAGLLRDAVASIIGAKEESDVDSFFGGGTTSFLENDIEGLDDFELICFLVVKPKC